MNIKKSTEGLIHSYKFISEKRKMNGDTSLVTFYKGRVNLAKKALLLRFCKVAMDAISEYNSDNNQDCMAVKFDVDCSIDGKVVFSLIVKTNTEDFDSYILVIRGVSTALIEGFLDKEDPFGDVEFNIKLIK